jgi:chitin synthase
MGCYQDGVAKDSVAGKDVTAHIFEYTTNVVVTDTGEVSTGPVPVQVIFCLKEQNKKKLNSHRWFFNAFGPLVKPNGTFTVTGVCGILAKHILSLHSSRRRN